MCIRDRRNTDKLEQIYQTGYRNAMEQMDALKAFLAKPSPLSLIHISIIVYSVDYQGI